MGFAGALKDVGLPRSEFLTALLTFNVGVETGQLAVIGAAFLLVGWHCADRAWYRTRIVSPCIRADRVYRSLLDCRTPALTRGPENYLRCSGAAGFRLRRKTKISAPAATTVMPPIRTSSVGIVSSFLS